MNPYKEKSKAGKIQFRPPLKMTGRAFVEDELIAENAFVFIERMSEGCIFMSIKTEKDDYSFDIYAADEDVTDVRGEQVRPIMLFARTNK